MGKASVRRALSLGGSVLLFLFTGLAHARYMPCEAALLGLHGQTEASLVPVYSRVSGKFAAKRAINPQNSRPDVSIVIPAYKEAERLPPSIARMKAFFNTFPLAIEVLIVVEKSPDDTVARALAAVGNDPRFQVIDNQIQRGKGYAVRSGMLRARGDIQFFMDADLSTSLGEILYFIDEMQTDPSLDIVIGDRAEALRGRAWHRNLMSGVFNFAVGALATGAYGDTQAGFKAFRRTAAEKIFPLQTQDRFSFDVEILTLASELGLKVKAAPIHWIHDERSTVKPLRDGVNMLVETFNVRRSVRGRLRLNLKENSL